MLKKVLFAVALIGACAYAELTLAHNGATDYAIVVPDKCHKAFTKEIEVFRNYLKDITGADFTIVNSADWKEGQRAISVGDTAISRKAGIDAAAMKRDEFVVKTAGDNLILAGFAMSGPCYAMYDFMERACGCRWYDTHFCVIPKHETLTIGDYDIKKRPSFSMRRIFTGGGDVFYDNGPHYLANAYKASYLHVPNEPFGRPGDTHTFWAYAKSWPKDNIKLLSKNEKGKRRRLIGAIGPNFCLSNPECAELMTTQLKDFIRQDRRDAAAYGTPAPFIYSLIQNDADHYFCHCEDCDAVVAELGDSGLLLTFINKIAREIAKVYPDVIIQTAAYAFTREPPKKKIEIEPNVTVELCHTVGNYYAPLEEDPDNVKCVTTWTSICNSMAAWDYWIFYWDKFRAPYHNVHQIAKDIRFYHRNGFKFARMESEDPAFANFFWLKLYLGYRLLYDVDADENAIITDFLNGYYGPAASEIREFMDYVAERQKGHNVCVFSEKSKTRMARPWLDKAFFAKCEEIFNRAEAKCPADSRYLVNVHRERIPVDIALLNLYDDVKPSVDLAKLIERHTAHRKEQIELRVMQKAKGEMLLKLEKEMEVFRNAEFVAKLKAAPKPRLVVPNAPSASAPVVWYTNSGCPTDRKLSLEACRDGSLLKVKLTEDGLRSAPNVGRNIWDGDDWEVMLASKREKRYFQILVDPNGKFLALLVDNTGNAKQNIEGLTVKSTLEKEKWTVEISFPLDNLPIKDIRYGNFFRGSQLTASAWSPTFENLFGEPEAFGEIIFK